MSDIKVRFAKIVKTTNGEDLDPKQIEVSKVRQNTNPDIKRNTECFVMAFAGGKLKGGMQYYYNRLDLGKVFQDQVPNIQMEYGTRTDTRKLAALLAERYGLDLLPSDVEPSGEFYLSTFPTEIDLIAAEGNLCVTGKITLRIVDAGEELSRVMGVTSLSGLNPPNGYLDGKIQGAMYSWNWVAQPQLVDILGTLQGGDAIPDTVIPYLDQLSGQSWVKSVVAGRFNIEGATLVYAGQRDNHPYYSNSAKRGMIYVIALGALATDIGGELIFAVSE